MVYVTLARLTLIVHFLFILFVVFGGLFVLRWPKLAWIHVPVFLWGAGILLVSAPCPLTPLEKWFLEQAHYPAYDGSFIEFYLLSVIYPAGLTRTIQLILASAVLIINGPIYWYRFGASSGSDR